MCNKSKLKIQGQVYHLDDPIPYSKVARILPALRSAGLVRTIDLSEREAYTSGERFKKYYPPFVEAFLEMQLVVSGQLTLAFSPAGGLDAAASLGASAALAISPQGQIDSEAALIADLTVPGP